MINRLKIKKVKDKKSQMNRKFTSSNVTNKIKINSKYGSANDNEKNNIKKMLK